jgi:hypothetical protein
VKNICILKTGIDVSKIKHQLEENANDWNSQRKIEGAESMLDRGWMEIDTGVLQLIIGAVRSKNEFVGDTELCMPTPAYNKHTEIVKFLQENGFEKHRRCGFLSIPVGSEVGTHFDEGTYYLNKDRFHLSIQGTYEYTVDGEKAVIEPGTLFAFNNKLLHSAKNVGMIPRWTFVFDVPRDSWNKQMYPDVVLGW